MELLLFWIPRVAFLIMSFIVMPYLFYQVYLLYRRPHLYNSNDYLDNDKANDDIG